MAKFFINQNMNKISIKHSGWQLYLSCIATRKKGWPYILHVRLMWSMAFVQTLRTLVLTFFFIAKFFASADHMQKTFSVTQHLQRRFFVNKTFFQSVIRLDNHDEWLPSLHTSPPKPPPQKREVHVRNESHHTLSLPACRRLLFPFLSFPFPFSACNKEIGDVCTQANVIDTFG